MFLSIFTLHPNLSTTLSSHHLCSHWCKRQSESVAERKLPSFWYAAGETWFALTSLCSASVWTLVTTNVREQRWQPSDFLGLPSHCNLSLPSAEEAVITQSSQVTTGIEQNLLLYHCRPAFSWREKCTMNFQRRDLYRTKVINDSLNDILLLMYKFVHFYLYIFWDWN